MSDTVCAPLPLREDVLWILWRDPSILKIRPIAHESALVIVEWNRDSSFREPRSVYPNPKVVAVFLRESQFFDSRMNRIKPLELEIERWLTAVTFGVSPLGR